jgi:hypothetical protein
MVRAVVVGYWLCGGTASIFFSSRPGLGRRPVPFDFAAAGRTDPQEHPAGLRADSRDQRSFAFWSTLWLSACRPLAADSCYCLNFSDCRQLPAFTDALQADHSADHSGPSIKLDTPIRRHVPHAFGVMAFMRCRLFDLLSKDGWPKWLLPSGRRLDAKRPG